MAGYDLLTLFKTSNSDRPHRMRFEGRERECIGIIDFVTRWRQRELPRSISNGMRCRGGSVAYSIETGTSFRGLDQNEVGSLNEGSRYSEPFRWSFLSF